VKNNAQLTGSNLTFFFSTTWSAGKLFLNLILQFADKVIILKVQCYGGIVSLKVYSYSYSYIITKFIVNWMIKAVLQSQSRKECHHLAKPHGMASFGEAASNGIILVKPLGMASFW
jgi:hypothetical protein